MKKFASVFLSVTFWAMSVCAQRPACPSGTTADVDCWECGSNCTAYLSADTTNPNGNKQLNFIGSGNMRNYGYTDIDGSNNGEDPRSDAPWDSQRSNITSVVIEGKSENSSGITSIGQRAVYLFKNLQSIDIPDSVTSIKYAALAECGLTNLVIPDSVTSISDAAFGKSNNLTSIVIPDSVTSIDGIPFNQLSAKIYCPQIDLCSGKGVSDENIVEYSKEDGVYKVGDNYFASANLMANNKSCKDKTQCQDIMRSAANGQAFMVGGKFYNSLDDFASGQHINKRIYTVEEANTVAGKKNSVMIRYK